MSKTILIAMQMVRDANEMNKKESEVEDVMDDDDIITVDENEVEINNGEENANIEIISSAITNKTGRKRKPCLGLCSDLIAKYVDSRAPNRLG
ncbi:hypothetical protein RhiirA5_427427 [Rhizophagus irregularis]|uniref:Uncharacterized protein n=1 Tax=Rhizophagus irregularis TaxID=588596 RepID=A0A2I1EC23_9GLOM|nr:hypothetical protein RhiirA5_427427 [Rhizophagus irregularis]PKC64754.1 hypothetical protein RhiirA1_461971 [Rhizophagus irregularis]PKY19676.1 hypothetical protein RhiirB3_432784 [Rhizophagus irregularis]CAB5203710.1 unnamed protein product [Rhizophagus irregularis]